MFKTLSVSALVAIMATASFAGSLAPVTETTVEDDDGVFAPAVGSGIGVPVVVGAVAAAAVLAAVAGSDSDSETTTTESD